MKNKMVGKKRFLTVLTLLVFAVGSLSAAAAPVELQDDTFTNYGFLVDPMKVEDGALVTQGAGWVLSEYAAAVEDPEDVTVRVDIHSTKEEQGRIQAGIVLDCAGADNFNSDGKFSGYWIQVDTLDTNNGNLLINVWKFVDGVHKGWCPISGSESTFQMTEGFVQGAGEYTLTLEVARKGDQVTIQAFLGSDKETEPVTFDLAGDLELVQGQTDDSQVLAAGKIALHDRINVAGEARFSGLDIASGSADDPSTGGETPDSPDTGDSGISAVVLTVCLAAGVTAFAASRRRQKQF